MCTIGMGGVLQAGLAAKSGMERCQTAHDVIGPGRVETDCTLRASVLSSTYRVCEMMFCELDFCQYLGLHQFYTLRMHTFCGWVVLWASWAS